MFEQEDPKRERRAKRIRVAKVIVVVIRVLAEAARWMRDN